MPASLYALTLAGLTTIVRQDLNDTDSTNYRWSDAIIQREIDNTLDRYSFVAPRYQLWQIPSITQSRLYPAPAGAWWVQTVEYPIGLYPRRFVTFSERVSPLVIDPGSAAGFTPITLTRIAGGTLSGTYGYAVTLVDPAGGETLPTPAVSITVGAGSGVSLANLPTGPYGIVGRNLYRTAAGGGTLKLAAQILDNTSTNAIDTLPDGSLGVAVPLANTTAGSPLFELNLSAASLPADTSSLLEVTAASKHQLDVNGTSVPEQHWDALALGAEAFCLYQYLVDTNDNFEYVDGQFRDRVDDTRAPLAWKAQADAAMQRFEARLTEIRNQSTAIAVPYPQWGDKPVRWDRL